MLIWRQTAAIVEKDDLKPASGVDARLAGEPNGRPTLGAAQAEAATPAGGQSSPEQLVDLRGPESRTPSGSSIHSGDDGAPPPVPGWRFVDSGTAIAFSDGHAWRRTIAPPMRLDAHPGGGLKQALRATGGMRPNWRHSMTDLDRIRWLTLLLVVTTEYRELLYWAAVNGFEGPVLVERDVRLLMPGTGASARDGPGVTDEGKLRIDLDRFAFTGSRYTRTAGSRLVITIQEDIDGGQLSVVPSGDRPWQLHGVSPVGVFAAASACRMTAEEARGYRSRPAKKAAELLDPMDPALPIPGDDLVLELEGLCRQWALPLHGARARRPRR